MGRTWIRPHVGRRRGKRFRIKGHWRQTVGSRAKGRTGEKFKRLQKRVAKGYVGKKVSREYQHLYGKTYSQKEAMEVGAKVAGKRFWKIEGKRRGRRILRRER